MSATGVLPRIRRVPVHLFALVGLSLTLNAVGITWGLPLQWHPDEALIRGGLRTMAEERSLDPRFYSYGLFHYYELMPLSEVPARIIRKVALARGVSPDESDRQYERWAILLGRAVSVLLGTGVVLVGLAYGSILFGSRTGKLAGWLLALSAGVVIYSHFLTVDISSMFWYSLAGVFCALIYKTGDRKHYLLAALVIGISASVKYVGILAVIPLVVAHFLRRERLRSNLVLALGATVVAALLTSPLSFLSPFGFLEGVSKEFFFNTGRVWAPQWNGHDPANPGAWPLLRFLGYIRDALGWPLFIGALLGTLYGVALVTRRRYRAEVLLTWAFVLPYFLAVGTHRVSLLWYTLPILMFLVVLAAKWLTDLGDSSAGRLGRFGVGVILAYSFLYCVAADLQFLRDSRTAASRWIQAHLPEGSRIELTGSLPPALPKNRYAVTNLLMSGDMYEWIELGIQNRDRNRAYQLTRSWGASLERAAQRAGLAGSRDPYVAWYESPSALADYRDVATKEAEGEWSAERLRARRPDAVVMMDLDPHRMRWSRQAEYYRELFGGRAGYDIAAVFRQKLPWLTVEIPHVNPKVTILTPQASPAVGRQP